MNEISPHLSFTFHLGIRSFRHCPLPFILLDGGTDSFRLQKLLLTAM